MSASIFILSAILDFVSEYLCSIFNDCLREISFAGVSIEAMNLFARDCSCRVCSTSLFFPYEFFQSGHSKHSIFFRVNIGINIICMEIGNTSGTYDGRCLL